MKVLHKDLKKKQFKLKTENLDDLWHMQQFVEPGDYVKGKTIRRIKIDSDTESRGKSAERKPVFLKIKVEKAELSQDSHTTRILGTIEEGPEDIPLGTHHTFNIDEQTTITITKSEFFRYHLDILENAQKTDQANMLIVVFEREETTFARLKQRGYEILTRLKGDVQKKGDPSQTKSNFFAETINQIYDYDQRFSFQKIIIGTSTIWKDYLLKETTNDKLKSKFLFVNCNNGGEAGINEILKRDELTKILKDDRTSKELALVEDLLYKITNTKEYAYGLKDVDYAAQAGAIKEFMITDKYLGEMREKGKYDKIESIMKYVEKFKGKINIILSENEGGKKLDGLGGTGAILRYPIS